MNVFYDITVPVDGLRFVPASAGRVPIPGDVLRYTTGTLNRRSRGFRVTSDPERFLFFGPWTPDFISRWSVEIAYGRPLCWKRRPKT